MTLPEQSDGPGVRSVRHPRGRRPADTERETVLLDHEAVERKLSRIAHEIIEVNPELDKVALVGIHTRGVPLDQRLQRLIADYTCREVALGQLDITFYRYDAQ